MDTHVEGCLGCALVRGEVAVPGGLLLREGGLVLHALVGKSPLPGWVVLTAERHARALYDLDAGACAALGPLAARVMRAQRSALGAEHVYAFAIGDVLHHFHLHLVPRYPTTPGHLCGHAAFGARPEDERPEAELAAAAARLKEALSRG